jgi:peptidoglycan/xylan/chitin deacetylase (PgdA/CDA1 family)
LPLYHFNNQLKSIYQKALQDGHEIAYHSHTHPPFSTLPDFMVDTELDSMTESLDYHFAVRSSYFRPPFGIVDARLRRNLAQRKLQTIMWSVDIKDYLYMNSPTPEKQLDAFNEDVSQGGNLVVMHYLSQSTVDYFQQMIQVAKSLGMNIMPINECLSK